MSQQLNKIIEMGDSLHQLAATESWQELNDLALVRQQNLEKYFSAPPLVDPNQIVLLAMKKIAQQDEKTKQLLAEIKHDAIFNCLKMKNSRNAINQYQATTVG